MTSPRLHPDDLTALVEGTARRTLELLREEGAIPGTPSPKSSLLTAHDVARCLGVNRGWVYDNAERLGAVQIGGGKRPRLRFDPERVAAAFEQPTSREGDRGSARTESPAPPIVPRRRRRRSPDTSAQLLPIRGR